MTIRNRALARVGAAMCLTLGAFFFAATPASAAGTETDLELTFAGTTLAANSYSKSGWVKVTNKGPGTPRELTINADLSELDFDKIYPAPTGDGCFEGPEPTPKEWNCEVPADRIPGPGETLDLMVVIFKVDAGGPPYSAPVTFRIISPDDTTADNDTKTVDLVFGPDSGVDLGVTVPDVKERIDPATGDGGVPLRAGDTTVTRGTVFNWGDVIAQGIRVTVRLPEHVTFVRSDEECDYSAEGRTATCTYPTIVLTTVAEYPHQFAVALEWPIVVAAGVEGPVTLPDGSWTVAALGQVPPGARIDRTSGDLPENATMVSADEAGLTEIDESDNADGFAVVVSGEGGGGGGDNGLPVTGVRAGLLGGVGLAVVVAGGALLLMGRRRKVVLVLPDDGKPTA